MKFINLLSTFEKDVVISAAPYSMMPASVKMWNRFLFRII